MRALPALALLLSSIAVAQPAAPAASAPATAANLNDVYAKLDALFAQRGAAGPEKELGEALNEAVKAHPTDFGVLWRAARFKYWQADGSTGDRKRDLGKEAWGLGDRAIKANPRSVEGYLYAAIGMGAYSQAVGVIRALTEGLENQFNSRLDSAIKLDANYDHGAPVVAKARYFYELPWPKRDLNKSASMLTKESEKHPENLRTYLFLAETLLADGKAKEAKTAIDRALSGDVSYDPPEGRRVQQNARRVKAQIEEKLK